MTVEFEAGWCATDLGNYRPCRYTYELYSYDTLPPLDEERFTGEFRWLGEAGEVVADRAEQMRQLGEKLSVEGLELPKDFVTFQVSSNLWDALDAVSVTACWSSLSDPLPSPVEPGAFLVRFFRDQQDCVFWYLYLRPSGEAFVVSSYVDYEYEYEVRPNGDFDDAEAHRAAIHWCAPTFEAFAYRFWLENRLWHHVNNGGDQPIDPAAEAYLDHYKGKQPPDGAVPSRSVDVSH